jgi:hypothetical protein
MPQVNNYHQQQRQQHALQAHASACLITSFPATEAAGSQNRNAVIALDLKWQQWTSSLPLSHCQPTWQQCPANAGEHLSFQLPPRGL